MDTAKVTPKDFFLWAGAMLTLYVGVFNYIALVWDYTDYVFPTLRGYYGNPYQNGVSWEMASLIVLVPVFLLLMWLIRRDIAANSARRELWVRRWALFLTLFVAGVTAVTDLIWVLYAFLNGSDVTTQFLLKALVVLLVAAIGFMHFIADLWNYWEQFPRRNQYVAGGVLVLVFITIVTGFFVVGTPGQARTYTQDLQRVTDLQTIQYQIVNYWQHKQALPAKLADAQDSLSNITLPTDPVSGQSYEYQATGSTSFRLCATFGALSQDNTVNYSVPVPAGLGGPGTNENWQHGAGRVCFDRTIDPQLYPPVTTPTTTTAAPVKPL